MSKAEAGMPLLESDVELNVISPSTSLKPAESTSSSGRATYTYRCCARSSRQAETDNYPHIKYCKVLLGGVVVLIIGATAWDILTRGNSNNHGSNTDLRWDFNVPYVGANYSGGEFFIYNVNPTQSYNVTGYSFDTNAELVADSYQMWDTLYPWGTEVTSADESNGDTVYQFSLPGRGVLVPPLGSAKLAYQYSQVNGPLAPFGIGMNPTRVTVTTVENPTSTTIPIYRACEAKACENPVPNHRSIGYFTNWGGYQYPNFNPASVLGYTNQFNYAFLSFDETGTTVLTDNYADSFNFPQLSLLGMRAPYLDRCLSYGGWSLSSGFSAMAADPVTRSRFISSAASVMQATHANCIDFDWEYPTAADSKNFAALISETSTALSSLGPRYFVTAALPGGADQISAISPGDWQVIGQSLRYAGLMTYDFNGDWNAVSGPLAPLHLDPNANANLPEDSIQKLYNVESTINQYKALNAFQNSQLVVGISTDGRSVLVDSQDNCGLYQNVTGTPPGQFDDSGIYFYRCIINSADCGVGGQTLPADTRTISAWSNPETINPSACSSEAKMFVGYEDPDTAAALVTEFVQPLGLGGGMVWSMQTDAPNSLSLGKNMADAMNSPFQSTAAKPAGATSAATRPTSLFIDAPMALLNIGRNFLGQLGDRLCQSVGDFAKSVTDECPSYFVKDSAGQLQHYHTPQSHTLFNSSVGVLASSPMLPIATPAVMLN